MEMGNLGDSGLILGPTNHSITDKQLSVSARSLINASECINVSKGSISQVINQSFAFGQRT